MGEVQLFVVRVWRHRDAFRASVRGVGDEEPRFFEQPGEVAEFLRRAAEADAPGDEGPGAKRSA